MAQQHQQQPILRSAAFIYDMLLPIMLHVNGSMRWHHTHFEAFATLASDLRAKVPDLMRAETLYSLPLNDGMSLRSVLGLHDHNGARFHINKPPETMAHAHILGVINEDRHLDFGGLLLNLGTFRACHLSLVMQYDDIRSLEDNLSIIIPDTSHIQALEIEFQCRATAGDPDENAYRLAPRVDNLIRGNFSALHTLTYRSVRGMDIRDTILGPHMRRLTIESGEGGLLQQSYSRDFLHPREFLAILAGMPFLEYLHFERLLPDLPQGEPEPQSPLLLGHLRHLSIRHEKHTSVTWFLNSLYVAELSAFNVSADVVYIQHTVRALQEEAQRSSITEFSAAIGKKIDSVVQRDDTGAIIPSNFRQLALEAGVVDEPVWAFSVEGGIIDEYQRQFCCWSVELQGGGSVEPVQLHDPVVKTAQKGVETLQIKLDAILLSGAEWLSVMQSFAGLQRVIVKGNLAVAHMQSEFLLLCDLDPKHVTYTENYLTFPVAPLA